VRTPTVVRARGEVLAVEASATVRAGRTKQRRALRTSTWLIMPLSGPCAVGGHFLRSEISSDWAIVSASMVRSPFAETLAGLP
jgi:hypothetical protein